MNKILLKTLQDKYKDFGLTEKAIEELARAGLPPAGSHAHKKVLFQRGIAL